jgi:hypothetical protein
MTDWDRGKEAGYKGTGTSQDYTGKSQAEYEGFNYGKRMREAERQKALDNISNSFPSYSGSSSTGANGGSSGVASGGAEGSPVVGLVLLAMIMAPILFFSLRGWVYNTVFPIDVRFKWETGCAYFPAGKIYNATGFNTSGTIFSAADRSSALGQLKYGQIQTYEVLGACEAGKVAIRQFFENRPGSASTNVAVTEGSNLMWIPGQEHPAGTTIHEDVEQVPKAVIPARGAAESVDHWCRDNADLKNLTGYLRNNYVSSCVCENDKSYATQWICRNKPRR